MTHECFRFLDPSIELGAGAVALRLSDDFGWPVFPVFGADPKHPSGCRCHDRPIACRRPGKHPRIKGGHLSASSDPQKILEWWSGWQRVSNLGIALRGAGLLVLDLDVSARHTASEDGTVRLEELSGVDTLRDWLAAKELSLPRPRYTVSTPGGGVQLYFRKPNSWAAGREVRALPCVDVLSDGYVVTAPGWRVVQGEVREYAGGTTCPCQTPELPNDVADALNDEALKAHKKRHDEQAASAWDGTGGQVDIQAMKTAGVPMGEQDVELWRAACSLAFKGLGVLEVSRVLWEICEASARAGEVDPKWPWTLRDCEEKARRAVARAKEEQADLIPWPGLTTIAPVASGNNT